jgi:hypothetical protein
MWGTWVQEARRVPDRCVHLCACLACIHACIHAGAVIDVPARFGFGLPVSVTEVLGLQDTAIPSDTPRICTDKNEVPCTSTCALFLKTGLAPFARVNVCKLCSNVPCACTGVAEEVPKVV